MPASQLFRVDRRDVYLITGTISQTVNVCTESNRKGFYGWKIRLPIDRTELAEVLRNSTSISELITLLTETYAGDVELSPSGNSGERLEPLPPPRSAPARIPLRPAATDDHWIERAKSITELCINEQLIRRSRDCLIQRPSRWRTRGLIEVRSSSNCWTSRKSVLCESYAYARRLPEKMS